MASSNPAVRYARPSEPVRVPSASSSSTTRSCTSVSGSTKNRPRIHASSPMRSSSSSSAPRYTRCRSPVASQRSIASLLPIPETTSADRPSEPSAWAGVSRNGVRATLDVARAQQHVPHRLLAIAPVAHEQRVRVESAEHRHFDEPPLEQRKGQGEVGNLREGDARHYSRQAVEGARGLPGKQQQADARGDPRGPRAGDGDVDPRVADLQGQQRGRRLGLDRRRRRLFLRRRREDRRERERGREEKRGQRAEVRRRQWGEGIGPHPTGDAVAPFLTGQV